MRIVFQIVAALFLPGLTHASEPPPVDWIEPKTGHRVVRLSREPGSVSLYFHQNTYTTEGDKLVISTPSGLATVTLSEILTRRRGGAENTDRSGSRPGNDQEGEGKGQLEIVVPQAGYSMGGSSGIEVGRKSRQVYYAVRGETGTVIRATHLDTKATRDVFKLPFFGAFNGVNADETLLVGTFSERSTNSSAAGPASLSARARLPRSMKFYSADLRSGELKFFNPSTNWLNHAQCSPTDPTMMLYCHEGPWHEVDRVWTLRIGSDQPKLMHRRTIPYEIAGHEFFGYDGQWVWCDLQTPRAQEFWLAGIHLSSGERVRYALQRSEWSVHYNVSRDGQLFAGDGGGPDSVANKTPMPENKPLNPPGNGQWIYLFRPSAEFETKMIDGEKVKVGRFTAEKLVDLSKHDYRLEPNVTFTPDGKWIVFRSNMHGERHVYAVEVARASPAK